MHWLEVEWHIVVDSGNVFSESMAEIKQSQGEKVHKYATISITERLEILGSLFSGPFLPRLHSPISQGRTCEVDMDGSTKCILGYLLAKSIGVTIHCILGWMDETRTTSGNAIRCWLVRILKWNSIWALSHDVSWNTTEKNPYWETPLFS